MRQIVLKQVAKHFGDIEVIKPLDLQINDGEFVVFVGPSGCGKSTLLRLIAGLEDVTSGHILINGKDTTQLAPSACLTCHIDDFTFHIFFNHVLCHCLHHE